MPAILVLIVLLAAGRTKFTEVCAEDMDLAFIVDGSDSVCGGPDSDSCDNWDSILQFIRDLVDSLVIGPDDTKVALATFGDEATVIWYLDGYSNKEDLQSAIDGVGYPGGELKTQGLVKVVITEIFSDAAQRPDARNVTVMFTDGAPYINASASLQKKGITKFVVCIAPGCDDSFAQGLSTPPKEVNKTYFIVNGYDEFGGIKDALLAQINNPENEY